MKKWLRDRLRSLHVIGSQLFLVDSVLREIFSFYKVRNVGNIKVDLSKNDLYFIDATWVEFHDKIVRETNVLSFLFFNEPSLIKTMTADSFRADYKPFLKSALKVLSHNELSYLLKENAVGGPRVLINSLSSRNNGCTSLTRAVHIYQLSKLTKALDLIPDKRDYVVAEWGGGYGGLCNIFYRKYSFESTYVIVDIPVSIRLQYIYLATIYGSDKIVVLQDSDSIVSGKINLISLSHVKSIRFNCDVFVSSWAISESNMNSQNYVVQQRFFDCKYIVLFHQEASEVHSNAEYLANVLKANYEVQDTEEVPVWSNQHFLLSSNRRIES